MTIPCSPDTWQKSSYSSTQTNCVEVRRSIDTTAMRDTKNRTAGHLTVPAAAWTAFLKRATR